MHFFNLPVEHIHEIPQTPQTTIISTFQRLRAMQRFIFHRSHQNVEGTAQYQNKYRYVLEITVMRSSRGFRHFQQQPVKCKNI